MVTGRRAVVIMAREPTPGRTKTRLHPMLTPQQAADLATAFLLDTATLVRRIAGVDLVVAVDPPGGAAAVDGLVPGIAVIAQVGPDLGARLDRAITDCLGQGYRHVVAVGADSPTLPPDRLVAAFDALEGGATDVVLGPADDGGYYLLGVSDPPGELVTGVTMSTPRVLADTLAVADRSGRRVRLLDPWYDVDEPEDLVRLAAELATTGDLDVGAATRRVLAGLAVPVRPGAR